MSTACFQALRNRRTSRVLIALAVVAVFLAGLAQASHFHKSEPAGGDTHLQCLLCMHADRAAPPPTLPSVPLLLAILALPLTAIRVCFRSSTAHRFYARGPPAR